MAALVGSACASGPFDLEALAGRHPALAGVGDHRLGELNPYLWPERDRLRWFACRWQTGRPLAVSLPTELTARDHRLLLLALESLEAAGLGVRFAADAAPESADIVLRMGAKDASKSGRTTADCAVDRSDGFTAALVRAEVALQRSNESVIGKQIALSEAEWVGTAIHELGHALGFQGHVSGPGPMTRNVEQVRAIGRRVLSGGRLDAPSLRALYALPSGSWLRRDPLPRGRTAGVDRLAKLARARGYRGPFVRVGGHAARLEWFDPRGRSVSVWVPGLRAALKDPRSLQLVPDPVAASWLAPGS